MRLGLVLAGPVHSCVGAAGRFAAVFVLGGGGDVPRDTIIIGYSPALAPCGLGLLPAE